MKRSKRKHETSFSQGNPSQSYRNRRGDFEDAGTGYRYEDERSENPQFRGRFGGGRWQEEGRQPWGQSRYSESRDYGPDYERESRSGRGRRFEGPREVGQQDWYQGFPQSRGWGGRDWEQGSQREYSERDDESRFGRGTGEYGYGREDYETGMQGLSGYEPGDYSYSGSGDVWRSGSRQQPEGSRGLSGQGASPQSYPGRFEQRRQWSTPGRGWQRGSYAGIGPQGYKRSDERIMEDVNEMLTQDPEIDPSNITVEVHNGEVTLKGTVSDRDDKRRAEDIAESCSGVREVQNQLRVKREEESESKREKGEEKQRSSRQQIAS